MSEHALQCSVIDWANMHVARYPVLSLLHATPNGGKRPMRTAIDLKSSGVKRGVPDLQLPIARKSYIGLWLELKVGRNKPTPEQYEWIDALRAERHRAEVVYSAERAVEIIYYYLGMDCSCELCLSMLQVKP